MFILKRLLQLQVGRFNFRNNESLNILGSIGKKKDPLIPFDPDMQGCVLITQVLPQGLLKVVAYENGYTNKEYVTISSVVTNGTLAPAS